MKEHVASYLVPVVLFLAMAGLPGCAGPEQHASRVAYPDAVTEVVFADKRITVRAEKNGRHLVAETLQGVHLWQVDVIHRCGSPTEGRPVIRNLRIEGNRVHATVGDDKQVVVTVEEGTVECR